MRRRNIAPAQPRRSGRTFKETCCIPRQFSAALFLALIFIAQFSVLYASEATTTETNAAENTNYAEIDLHELTDEELIAICENRGFELVGEVDGGTGEPLSYTHDDYVDAARECLRLEAEMEEFYNENPNLLGELEEERERMIKENEELKKKLDEAQERLESERDEAKETKSSAFVSSESLGEEKKQNESKPVSSDGAMGSVKGGDEEKKEANAALKELLNDDSDSILDLDDEDSASDKATRIKEKGEGSASVDEVSEAPKTENDESLQLNETASEMDVEPVVTEVGSGPLATLKLAKEVALEVRDRVKRDFTYAADILVPKPIRGPLKKFLRRASVVAKDISIKGADMAKRYAIAFFKSAKEAYEKRRQAQQESGGEKSEN